MSTVEGSRKINLLLIVLVFVVSSVTLWLLESPLKPMLYFFEAALTLTIYHSLHGKLKKTSFKIKGITVSKLDYTFLTISLMLLVFNIFKLSNTLSLVFAIVVSFFLPGYVLLRLLKFHSLNTWLEWLVLAFALSIGLTSLIVTLTLSFTTHRAILISAIYVVISLSLLLKDRIDKSGERLQIHENNRTNEYNLFDASLLLWISLFFILVVSSLYPQMAYLPGLDIVEHFSSSRLLTLVPDAYQSIYPWFHQTWAAVYELSSPLMEVFQTGLAYLSLIVVFSFYIMVKAYLSNIDKRAPILATIFFSVFSGFGWLHFLREKLITLDPSKHMDILRASNDASYWDIGYGQGPWIWLWFRPLTLAFTLFFVLLYLLSRNNLSKRTFITIFSFLIVTLGFIHVPELMLFNVFLLVLALFMPKTLNLRLKEASLATLIGSITYFSYAWISSTLGGIVKSPPMDTLLILAGTATLSCILTRRSPRQLMINPSANRQTRFVEVFTIAIALVFMSGLLVWFSFPKMFSVSQVYEIFYIPLMMYPVLLGIVGFFALHGLVVITKKYKKDPAIVPILLFLVVLAFGKLVSFLNVEFCDLGYGERRFLPVIFAAASMMASVSFVKQASKLLHDKKKVLLTTIMALIVIAGVTSTNLSVEYWKLTTETPRVSHYALEAAEYLSSPHNRDIRTPILTASTSTRSIAEYIPSPYVVDKYRYPIWESRHPEAPLLILYNKYYPPPYLYVDQQDFDYISSRYMDDYFAGHMLRLLPKAYSNPEVTAFRVPEGVPPSLDSNVVLIIPNDNRTDYLSAYDTLSLGGYDYTVCLNSDTKTITDGETIIIPRDDENYIKLLENLALQAEFQQGDKEVIIFNLNGYGPFADLFFESEVQAEDIRATHIKGLESTLDLPIEVDAYSLIERDNIRVLAWYSDGKEETPFAAELVKDARRLVYINVYPIIKAGLKEETVTDSRQILNLLMGEFKDGKVNDVSMNGNDGLVYGAKIVDSPFGMALDFDGKESFIEVAHSDRLNPTDEISIEAWVKPRAPDSGFCIVSKKAGYSSLDGYAFLFDGGTFYFNFGNGTSCFPNAFPYGRLKAEQWYHLAVTYDGHYVKYYVNGAEVGSVEQSETVAPNNLNLLIGKRQDEVWKLNGSIYKIVMYDEALTTSEIEESYNKTMAKFWTMNPMSPIMGSLIQIAGVNLPTHVNYETWVFEGNTAFFRNASLKGDVVIKSSSFTDVTIEESANITIVTDQEQINVTRIKRLYINKTDYAEIHAEEVDIHQGRGFYAELTLVNPTLSLSGENVLITLVTSDQETREITFQNGELIILGQLTLYARTPSFQVNGEAKFKEIYSLFSLHRWLRSLGQNLNIQGAVKFQLTVSDTYNFASDLKWNGSVAREPPILRWNEYDSIKNMLPWLIISIVLVVFWHSFFKKEISAHNNKTKGHIT